VKQKPADVRKDIQALRAIAIGSVVFFHFWPELLPGGYAGVDIFFVVSGYLITGQLWRQVQLNGKINFNDFWARRARRLLPASLVTILAVVLIAFIRMPSSWYLKLHDEAIGATTYVQNWVLAEKSTNYLNADQSPSPLQHFWSLSVEEQYYVFWPVLMFGLLWLANRSLGKRNLTYRPAVLTGLTALLLGSLAYSVWLTATLPLYAYFSTFTRAWEFAGGALLAVWLGRLNTPVERAKARARNPAWWWLGLALIITSFSVLNTRTPYPSFWAAIPVAGAIAFLFGGESSSKWVPQRVIALRPVQFLGDISYSLYLWHWPIITLAPWFISGKSNDIQRIGLVALAIFIGWLSKKFIEDPVRFGWLSRLANWKQLVAAAIGMAVVAGSVTFATNSATATLHNKGGQDRVWGNSESIAKIDFKPKESGNCLVTRDKFGFRTCSKGDLNGKFRVGLIGDSHTRQYFIPIDNLAFHYHWQLTMISKSACPIANIAIFPDSVPDATCKNWNGRLQDYLASVRPFDLIINSNSSLVTFGDPKVAAAYAMTVKTQLARGTKWFVIKDNPKPMENFIPCIAAAGKNAPVVCANSRKAALTPPDILPTAIAKLPGVTVANFTDVFCRKVCPPILHQIIVYRDNSHITSRFSRLLQPKIRARIPAEFKQ
jgi:hypothetical protein